MTNQSKQHLTQDVYEHKLWVLVNASKEPKSHEEILLESVKEAVCSFLLTTDYDETHPLYPEICNMEQCDAFIKKQYDTIIRCNNAFITAATTYSKTAFKSCQKNTLKCLEYRDDTASSKYRKYFNQLVVGACEWLMYGEVLKPLMEKLIEIRLDYIFAHQKLSDLIRYRTL